MHEVPARFASDLCSVRSPRTAATYASVAGAFLDHVAAGVPNRRDVEAFLARPRLDGSPRSAAGRNQELAALRAFSRFARREGLWDHDPTDGVPFVREPRRNPTVLSAPEVRRLFEVGAREPNPFRKARNLAILGVRSQAGLRVHELVGLDVDRTNPGGGPQARDHGSGQRASSGFPEIRPARRGNSHERRPRSISG